MNLDRKIYVNKKDIKYGLPGSPTWCPIALAIIRRMKAEHASVTPEIIRVKVNGRIFHGLLPEVAKKFVEDFDAGEKVAPISFFLESSTNL